MTTLDLLQQTYGVTMTFEQAAEELGLCWRTVQTMCLRGEIKAPRAGRKWILTTQALAEYLDRPQEKAPELGYTRKGYKKIV